jgi:internalin A
LCRKNSVKDKKAQEELLHLCDRLGTIRYFAAAQADAPPEFRNTAILNPKWVTAGIYALLDDDELKQWGGLLNRTQMTTILQKRGYPVQHERIIEEVMRRFDLLYDSGAHGPSHRMLIPLMLPAREPKMSWPKKGTLEFVYQYEVMPGGLVPAFMARQHKQLSKTVNPWRHGCVMEFKGCPLRVIGDAEEKRVSISVTGPEAQRRRAIAPQVA